MIHRQTNKQTTEINKRYAHHLNNIKAYKTTSHLPQQQVGRIKRINRSTRPIKQPKKRHNRSLLFFHASQISSQLPTFRDNILLLCSRVKHHHLHRHHHLANMQLGHFLSHSGLTRLEVSLIVSSGFCLLGIIRPASSSEIVLPVFRISPEWVTIPYQFKSSGRIATFSLRRGMLSVKQS